MNIRIAPLLLVLALPAACDRAATPAAPATPATPAAPADAAGATADAFPDAFVVSTNEPFWSARVHGTQVVLDGPDVSGRVFTVARSDDTPGARAVLARDPAGAAIEVRIAIGPCEDSMSGAVFPWRGSVALEGGDAATGCARDADMPPPTVPDGG